MSQETVFSKNDLIELIAAFMNQVQTDDQRYSKYQGIYRELNISAKFGQGNLSRIPWMAFTGYGQVLMQGIYPVLLFHRETKKLVVAYGVSQTNQPNHTWDITNKSTTSSLGWSDYKDSFIEAIFEFPYDVPGIANALDIVIDKFIDLFSRNSEKVIKMNNPKNIILYGPPGVGKTYSHKKLISILENGANLDELTNSNYRLDAFEEVRNEGRYQFLTFHQSYSYEDFVEGFRPTEEGTIQLQNGLFKDIAKQAKINQEASTAKEIKKDFDLLFRTLIVDVVSEGERLTIPMKRSRYHITEITDKSILFDKDSGESKHSLSINTLRKMYESNNNSLIIGGLQPYYDALLEYLSKNAFEMRTDELKNYYLILDEINRGNISKIFGELITLLEEDKRLGEENELMVTLPYSKERFGVPKNLYIIGTMNTADKSIALVDIALRRRFTFVRMEPLDEYLPENVKKINEIIKDRRGSDYLIGHAFFMGNQDHDFILKYKIRPLLEEYFYGENIDEIFEGLI